MTKQEILDKVVLGILSQGRPSIDPVTNVCLYRGPDGARCAAGHLILDEHYKPSFETWSVYEDKVWEALLLSGVPDDAQVFVDLLQGAHDEAAKAYRIYGRHTFLIEFREKVQELAAKYWLSMAAFTQHEGEIMTP